eukprot:gene40051-49524_t
MYNFNVTNSLPVTSLKTMIKDITAISEDRQRLIYRGKVLVDDTLLGEYRIEDGHTVQFVARPENYRELQAAAAVPAPPPPQANVPIGGGQMPQGQQAIIDAVIRDLMINAMTPTLNSGNPPPPQRIVVPQNSAVANALAANAALDAPNNMEPIRQGLLTLNTLLSTVDPDLLNGGSRTTSSTAASSSSNVNSSSSRGTS